MDLSATVSAPRGRLRIGLPLIGAPFLPMLTDFQLAYPEISLELDFDNRKVDVIEEGYDPVIRSGSLVDSQLMARSLGSFGSVIVGTPASFTQYGVPATPADLMTHKCVHLRNRHTGKLLPWPLEQPSNAPELQLPSSVVCNTNESQLAFVLKGAGLSCVPDFAVEEALAEGAVTRVLDAYTARSSFHLLWPAGGHMPLKLRLFIDFMVEKALPRD